MRVFYKKYKCPKCGIYYGQTEELGKELIETLCATCLWGNKK